MRRTRHVNAPDPICLLTNGSEGELAISLQALHPVPQRSRVVLSQSLDVPTFKSLSRHLLDDVRDVTELPARKNVLVDKRTDIAAELVLGDGVQRDAVIHHQT